MRNRSSKNNLFDTIKKYYNTSYYDIVSLNAVNNHHYRNLAKKIRIKEKQEILDIACGTGEWLKECKKRKTQTIGIDISEKAIKVCKILMPDADFCIASAEALPFADNFFDIITCFGALEHFLDPVKSLKEMIRVGKKSTHFLFLVPNENFIAKRLGLFKGTDQINVKEEARTLKEWECMFESVDVKIIKKWKDLHILSKSWIFRKGIQAAPIRFFQSLIVAILPLNWQYQVYFLCERQ